MSETRCAIRVLIGKVQKVEVHSATVADNATCIAHEARRIIATGQLNRGGEKRRRRRKRREGKTGVQLHVVD